MPGFALSRYVIVADPSPYADLGLLLFRRVQTYEYSMEKDVRLHLQRTNLLDINLCDGSVLHHLASD